MSLAPRSRTSTVEEIVDVAMRKPGWSVAALLGALLVGWSVFRRLGRLVRNTRRNDRRRRGERAEREAVDLLRARGHRILETQPTTFWSLDLDETPVRVELRADALVERRGKRWVAEFKSGTEAPDVRRSATRRQLLEYRCAYDVEGILLVDVEEGDVRRVEFDLE